MSKKDETIVAESVVVVKKLLQINVKCKLSLENNFLLSTY